ncbi:hypothetical protein RND81_01G079500 [Saponaria officinalis]|uniref:Uncharacterized protein n=1 Tax=Saponaria officinalis TaxID=3572 RepID=A0AAW1N956_SAPOF
MPCPPFSFCAAHSFFFGLKNHSVYGVAGRSKMLHLDDAVAEEKAVELDLFSCGTTNTIFSALFSILSVPIKTTVSATMLEEGLKLKDFFAFHIVAKCYHFYSETITEEDARGGFVSRVQSDQSKFKVLTQFTEMTSRYT